jgi:hypothetical protein
MYIQRVQDPDEGTQGSPIYIQDSTKQVLVEPLVSNNASNKTHSNKRKLETFQDDVSSFKRVRLLKQQQRQKSFPIEELKALAYQLQVSEDKARAAMKRILEAVDKLGQSQVLEQILQYCTRASIS